MFDPFSTDSVTFKPERKIIREKTECKDYATIIVFNS